MGCSRFLQLVQKVKHSILGIVARVQDYWVAVKERKLSYHNGYI